MGALKELRIFNAEFNDLKDIPASVGYLPELVSLKCGVRVRVWVRIRVGSINYLPIMCSGSGSS